MSYPDLELVKKLRRKFVGSSIHSMTTDEIVDLINHQHERIQELERASKPISGGEQVTPSRCVRGWCEDPGTKCIKSACQFYKSARL